MNNSLSGLTKVEKFVLGQGCKYMVQVDVDTAIFNPASVFKKPEEILQDSKVTLTKEQKIRALQTWRYDIQLRRVAEEENMLSEQDQKDVDLEISILQALKTLGVTL